MLWGATLEYWDTWGLRLMITGGILAALAVVFSLASSYILYRVSAVAQSELQGQTSQANAQAAGSMAIAADARKRAATLEKEAASLKAQAESDRLARVKIEQKMAPRLLSGEQQRAVSEKVRPFAPQPFQFISYQDDPEVRGLLLTIGAALLRAGWEGRPPTGFLMIDLVMGVAVELTTANASTFGPAANVLAEALNEAGIAATVQVNPKVTDPMDTIRIRVGRKP